tara:strand:+ start:4141 stop:4842 length:702 start_codon:yes stop_codon:yes gene_type:complete
VVYGGKEPEEAVLRGPDADRRERRRRRRERRRADQEQQMAPVTSGGSIGTLNYANTNRGFTADELPAVSDPDATYADVVEGQYEQYIRNFRDFENALIASRNSTDLIDAAREDTPQQIALAEGIARRNRERYGYRPTAVEAQEMQRATQRGGALTLAGGLNNARLAQRDANQRLLSDLINIGQGVNRSSLSGLGSAAQNAASRQQAFQNDRAAYKQQTAGFLGRIGSAVASFI